MQIPANYQPTLAAAQAYLSRNPSVAAEYARASGGNYDPVTAAWQHYTTWSGQYPQLTWGFPQTGPIASQSTQANVEGILNGKIFGIDTKLILIGVAAYLVFGSKD